MGCEVGECGVTNKLFHFSHLQHKSPIPYLPLPITHPPLPIPNYPFPITNSQFPIPHSQIKYKVYF